MYCSSCGYNLKENDKFCSSCGEKLMIDNDYKKKIFKTHHFSSNILLGGNLLTPDRIIITDSEVVYRRRNKYLIGIDESSIPFTRISSVEIDRKLIDAHILIYSTGNQLITAKDFSIRDSKRIKKIIEERIS